MKLNSQLASELKGDELAVDVWDLGGQEVFMSLLHLFLADDASYLVVFNMEDMLGGSGDDEKDGARGEPEREQEGQQQGKRAECVSYLTQWLQSIELHAPTSLIMLVGSRKDKIKRWEDWMRIDTMLCQELKGCMKFEQCLRWKDKTRGKLSIISLLFSCRQHSSKPNPRSNHFGHSDQVGI